MKTRNTLFTLLMCLLSFFSACRKDRYHSDPFRCVMNGKEYSTSDRDPDAVFGNSYNPKCKAELDSSARTLTLSATFGPTDGDPQYGEYRYTLNMNIYNFRGTGNYEGSVCDAKSTDKTKPAFWMDRSYDALIRISHYDSAGKKVSGYFHFVCKNISKEQMVFTRGRFSLPYQVL